jgi:hypothetical protein
MVMEGLGISKGERVRWARDGRLKHSGSVHFGRAHSVQISTYAPEFIQALDDDPSIIAG